MRISLLVIWYWITSVVLLTAQSSANNPFELVPLLPAAEQRAIAEEELATTASEPLPENPFELLPPSPGSSASAPIIETTITEEADQNRPSKQIPEHSNLLLFILLGSLLLLTSLFTLLRSTIYRVFEGILNENLLGQHFRTRKTVGAGAYFSWYSFAFISIGTFAFLVWLRSDAGLPFSAGWCWLICLAGVAGLLILKHLVLFCYGRIFPIYKTTSYYNFVIMVFSIALGLLLCPINALLAWGPDDLHSMMLYLGVGTIGLTYLFRTLRTLVLFASTISAFPLHFLLYICAVETTPLLVFIKLIINDLAI